MSVAAYLLNPLKNNYTWEDVAREHLDLMVDEKADQEIKACYEAYTNYASVEVLSRKLADTKMDTLFREIEMPLVFTLFDMEQNGIRVEAEALKQYGNQLAARSVIWKRRSTKRLAKHLILIRQNSWVWYCLKI